MNTRLIKLTFLGVALGSLLALPLETFAQHHGGGSRGSAHVSGSVTLAGHAPGGYGYFHGGVRPYYGGHHYYYGRPYYPYYHSGFFYPRHRFYGGLALGLFVASLPFYYDTIWWHGLP